MSDSPDEIPDFATLAADPEIAPLLDFEPVPRKIAVEGGWTGELQREFIARLAVHGSANKACDEMGKNRTGMTKLYNNPEGASFRAAWHGAVELAKRRKAERAPKAEFVRPGTRPPTLDHRRKSHPHPGPLPRAGEGGGASAAGREGQMRNHYGEWEDAESVNRRGEEAADSIRKKLLRIRRIFLQEISASPGKRAAFEILTGLPIDWDIAAEGKAQPDEPYRSTNQRQADWVLTAESGWSFGDIGYGPDRKAQARQAIDEYRAELGLEPIDWTPDDEEEVW